VTVIEIRPWLYIGNYREAGDAELLELRAIDAALLLVAVRPLPGRETLLLPVEDGELLETESLARGVAFVSAARKQGRRCLIACGAGVSRSTVFATAALREVERLPLLEAAAEVKRAHPHAVFHPTLWESLVAYAGEDVPFRDVLIRLGP
jgi:protein-tyrosine phosphatase